MKVTHLNRPPKVVFRLRVKESDIKLTVWRALISDTKQIKLSDGKKLNQSEWSPRLVETVLRVPESSCCVRVYFCTAYPFHTLKLKHTYRYSLFEAVPLPVRYLKTKKEACYVTRHFEDTRHVVSKVEVSQDETTAVDRNLDLRVLC